MITTRTNILIFMIVFLQLGGVKTRVLFVRSTLCVRISVPISVQAIWWRLRCFIANARFINSTYLPYVVECPIHSWDSTEKERVATCHTAGESMIMREGRCFLNVFFPFIRCTVCWFQQFVGSNYLSTLSNQINKLLQTYLVYYVAHFTCLRIPLLSMSQ